MVCSLIWNRYSIFSGMTLLIFISPFEILSKNLHVFYGTKSLVRRQALVYKLQDKNTQGTGQLEFSFPIDRFLGILSAFLRTSQSYNSFLSLRRIFSTCVIALAILFCALLICRCVKASNNPSSIHISIAVAKRPYFNCTLLFFCKNRSSNCVGV